MKKQPKRESKPAKKIRRRKPTATEKTYWSLPRTKKAKPAIEVMEIRLRSKIDDIDIALKTKATRRFLKAGHKVKIFARKEQLQRIIAATEDLSSIEFRDRTTALIVPKLLKKTGRLASAKVGSFDAYLLKQTKKNHQYLVQTLKARWRLSKSKNPKLKLKLARIVGSNSNTSAEALKSIEDHRARMRTEVMKEIMAQGAHGSTTYEIEQALNMLHQTASARVYELTGRGQIVDSGRRRKTGSGRNAVVHVQPQFQDSLESE